MAGTYKQLVFDADGQVASDELAFKDFGTSSIQPDVSSNNRMNTNGGSSDATSRLYEPDLQMQNQLGRAAGSSQPGWFSLDSYSSWFDVDTSTVLTRSWRTLLPKEDYLEIVVNNAPDLYGPFWVPTTLIFALFLSSSLSSSIQAFLAGNTYSYDFTKLSVAVSVVYTYALGVPVGLWAVTRYWAQVDARGPVDFVSLYGYSTTVWIFASLLAIPPIGILRFVFSLAAAVLSGFFLLRNIYPILSTSEHRAARILVVAIAVFHFAFAIILWTYFLNASEIGTPIVDPLNPNPTLPSPDGTIAPGGEISVPARRW